MFTGKVTTVFDSLVVVLKSDSEVFVEGLFFHHYITSVHVLMYRFCVSLNNNKFNHYLIECNFFFFLVVDQT